MTAVPVSPREVFECYAEDGLLKPDVIGEIERLFRISTRGPFRVERWGGDPHIVADAHVGAIADIGTRLDLPGTDPAVKVEQEANAALIATVLTHLPGLLLAARAMEALNGHGFGREEREKRVKKAKEKMPADLFAEPAEASS